MSPSSAVAPFESAKGIFTRRESRVRSYSRSFPSVFARAVGAYIYDTAGRAYLDFLSGAGSLNYGHNHSALQEALIEYLREQGIAHSLDLHTTAKARFLEAFEELILKPRALGYVMQFTGPTGANCVEAALKLARKTTGRTQIVSFTNGFHGVTLGALAATGNSHHRNAAGVGLNDVIRMPYDGYLGAGIDSLDYFEKCLLDPSSGISKPAAVILETVQGEGGLNVASIAWLRRLEALCHKHGMLLIVDDIQAGCGRTGTFFSFEPSDIRPDLVTLSKSLSGMGLPLAVTLIRRDLDIWEPGEHNGTFRGNNHAFVTAAATLKHFWSTDAFSADVRRKAHIVTDRLSSMVKTYGGEQLAIKGRGLMQGLACKDPAHAAAVSRAAFQRGLIIETSGPHDEVIKCLCPLVIEDSDLHRGLELLDGSLREVLRPSSRCAELRGSSPVASEGEPA